MYKTTHQVIEEAAVKWPQRPFIVSVQQDLEKTFRQVNEDSNRLASALLSIGVKKGDRVGIWSPNNYEWVVTQFGTAKIGAILVNVNPAYRVNEFVYCANLVGLSTLISCQKFKTSNYAEMLKTASPGIFDSLSDGIGVTSKSLPSLKNVIYFGDEGEPSPVKSLFWDLLQANTEKEVKPSWRMDPEDVCNIQFTSGTTGNPKGAPLTHHGTINNACYSLLEYTGDTSICVPNPLYHCMGCVLGTLAGAILGNTVVLPAPVFTANSVLLAIEKYKCEAVVGTPTMYVDLLRENKIKRHDLSSVKYIYMSGSPCPEKITREMKISLFPDLKRVIIPYGTTETSPVITLPRMSMPDEYEYKTVGSVLDHAELKIVNPENGQVLPRGETGEVWTRSVYVFPGYWEQADKTAEILDPRGWYKTGDLGCMNDDGYVSINGRIKDMVIRGGENIYPREIEELLLTHEAVLDANVVGVTDERMGEELAACIILKSGLSGSEELKESIRSFCKGKISHFKIPRYILFVDDYPRTVTVKVQKNKLKDIAEQLIQRAWIMLIDTQVKNTWLLICKYFGPFVTWRKQESLVDPDMELSWYWSITNFILFCQ